MFTRTGHRPRSFAAFCAAIVAAAALALLPSLPAVAADDTDLTALASAAAEARQAADAANAAAAVAESDAAAAASSAVNARAAADAACATAADATAALAATPGDPALEQADAACAEATGVADSAQAAADSAAAVAADATAQAAALEAAAVSAQAAYDAAVASTSAPPAVDPDPDVTQPEATQPRPEATDPEATEPECEPASDAGTGESTDETPADTTVPTDSPESTETNESTDPTETNESTEATESDPCADAVSSFSMDRRGNCERDMTFFSQNRDWDWCFPDPKIDIDVENYCPTSVEVEISHLWWWVDYTVTVNGVAHPIEVNQWGKASFTLDDVAAGKLEVKVYKGDKKLAWESEWIKDKCPDISTEVGQCTTIDGSAEVGVWISDLEQWRTYSIEITGPDYLYSDTTSWSTSWSTYLSLPPGTYTITVSSDGGKHKPDIGPVVYTFTVDPCPSNVTITINPTCGASGTGSLGASLSGLVPGREYWVTVTGPAGTVTDVTFVASEPTWTVPPEHLPPGTYTVTVVDTASNSGSGGNLKVEVPEPDPLSWTATGTIASCPALAMTGMDPSTQLLVPGLALLPLGVGLLIASRLRRRSTEAKNGAAQEAP